MSREEYDKLIRRFRAILQSLNRYDEPEEFVHAFVLARLEGRCKTKLAFHFVVDELRRTYGRISTARSRAENTMRPIEAWRPGSVDPREKMDAKIDVDSIIENIPSEVDQELVRMVYIDGVEGRSVARAKGVSESRVSQILRSALNAGMRAKRRAQRRRF